jgi:hypothetical protein
MLCTVSTSCGKEAVAWQGSNRTELSGSPIGEIAYSGVGLSVFCAHSGIGNGFQNPANTSPDFCILFNHQNL